MKVPSEVQAKIAELGQRVLADDASEFDIGEQGAGWLIRSQPIFALGVLSEWWRKRTRQWIYSQTRVALSEDDGDGEQLVLPFPELHPYLQIAPGTKKHQSVMTGRDWDNTLAIYRNRRDQAEVLFRHIERRYHQVRDLLGDDELTTADVVDRLAPVRAA
ncbi:MAG TPA: hypothetical protein VJN72_07190 [Gaiellales bacterium]|nr:hypothetical protein [Gaiellales bacterium]